MLHPFHPCPAQLTACPCAGPALMRATMGTLPYRRVFTEVYAVVALLAAVCLIPAARILTV